MQLMDEKKEVTSFLRGTPFGQDGPITAIIMAYAIGIDTAMVIHIDMQESDLLRKLIRGSTPQEGVKLAIRDGWTFGVETLIGKYKSCLDFDEILAVAARRGNVRVMVWALKNGATAFNWALCEAAEGGHKRAMYKIMEHGANSFDQALIRAIIGGFMCTIRLCLIKGARNLDEALHWGARMGRWPELLELLLRLGASDYNQGLLGAAAGGHAFLVRNFLSRGATEVDAALMWAAEEGRTSVILTLLGAGAMCIDSAYESAVKRGHEQFAITIAQLLAKKRIAA